MLDFLRKRSNPQVDHNFINPAKNIETAAAHVNPLASTGVLSAPKFKKVINFCLYLLVVLVPILFMSLTSEPREFNKQALLFFTVVLMLLAWVIRILTTRNVSWVKTSLDYILLAYMAVYLVSSLISIDKVSSFLGYYGRFTGSFVSVLVFVILYFLIVNNVRSERVVKRVVDCLTISTGIVLVYSLLQLLGWYILPFASTHSRSFNPIGSLAGLAIFAAFSLIFFQWLILKPEHNNSRYSRFKAPVLVFLSLVALAVLLVINAFTAWLVLALGMVAFLALSLTLTSTDTPQQSFLWKPMLVLVIAVLFVSFQFLPSVLNPRNLINVNLPVEIQLSNATTWNLVGNSMAKSAKQAVFGAGPGTTGIAFGSIKPTDLNKTIVWSLNFDRASSEIANLGIETGILGLVVFELFCLLFLIYGLFFLLKKTAHSGWFYALGFFMLWLVLYITHFFYFFNTTFYFLFWLSLAVFMAITHWSQSGEVDESSLSSLSSSPRSALSWMFASLLVLAVLLVGTFFEAAVVGGEAAYAAGVVQLNQAKPDFAKAANDFGRAIQLNPYRDVYYLAYAQNLIFQASEEAAKPKPNTQQIQSWMADTINAGQAATSISPEKTSNWSALAQFYTNIRPLVSGTDKFILDSWNQAIVRDPKNPSLYIQLAQAYSTASQTIDPGIVGAGTDTDHDGLSDDQEAKFGSDPKNPDTNGNGVSDGDEVKAGFNPGSTGRLTSAQLAPYMKTDSAMLKSAESNLNKAIALKPDLPDGYIALARVLEQGNKTDEAKKQLDAAAGQFPTNADILFEQGRLTFNAKDYLVAEKIFNNVLALVPNHANAMYSLGLIYQQRGDLARALAMFEKVREITGPNVDLEKQINSLK